jgi:hypothetical protein
MAGRGSFHAITSADVERLLALPPDDQWDFATGERAAVFVAGMDKAWVAIHRALADGTLFGTLGEPPLADAVLGEHLVRRTATDDFVYLKNQSEVAAIARELNGLSREQFEEKLAVVEPDDEDLEAYGLALVPDEFEYVWPYFEDMRAFYKRAAAEGLAVLFTWG